MEHLTNNPEIAFRQALQHPHGVGVNLRKNGSWFLRFAKKRLSSLRHEERQNIWEELLALALLATRSDKQAEPLSNAEQRTWRTAAKRWRYWMTNAPTQPDETSFEYKIWLEAILRIQEEVIKALSAILKNGRTALPISQVRYEVSTSGPGRLIYPLGQLVIGAKGEAQSGVEGAVLMRLGQVLDRLGSRLHRCKGHGERCNSPVFFASRADQVYCSTKCGMREFMRSKRRAQKTQQKPRRLGISKKKKNKTTSRCL